MLGAKLAARYHVYTEKEALGGGGGCNDQLDREEQSAVDTNARCHADKGFLWLQLFLVLRRSVLRNFARTNFYIEWRTVRLARHPNANDLIRNHPNKTDDLVSHKAREKEIKVQKNIYILLLFARHISFLLYLYSIRDNQK